MSFIQLQREPGIHYLAACRGFQSSPAFEHLFEAICTIHSIFGAVDLKSSLRVPLSDFAMFPIGSIFGSRNATLLRNRDRRRFRKKLLLTDEYETWDITRQARISVRRHAEPYNLSMQYTEKVFIDQLKELRSLGFAQTEQFRFICSGVSFLLDTLSLRSISSHKSLASMFVDEAETGVDERGTYVITPLRPFQNATATLQIALLLTNPDLADYIRFFFRRIGLAMRREAVSSERTLTYQNIMDCTIETEPILIGPPGHERTVDYCDRIIADHRKPTFKEIVIRIRNTRADEQIELIEELRNAEEREKLRVASSSKVRRYPADKRTVHLGRLDSDFGRLFPEYSKLSMRFDRETVSTGEGSSRAARFAPKTDRPDFVTPRVSSDLPKPGGTMPRVESAPIETIVFERPSLSTRFLAASDAPGLEARVAKLNDVPLLMREFFLAGYYMTEHRSVTSLPEIDLRRGEEVLYRLPPSWGGFAAPHANGLTRFAAAVPLAFDHGIVWAIEILRNDASEAFAMGLVAQLDRDDGLSFLGRVLRSVCDRVGRRRGDDLSGTFPRADFLDTRIDTVVHKKTVWDARTLAQLIPARAELLLSPERNF